MLKQKFQSNFTPITHHIAPQGSGVTYTTMKEVRFLINLTAEVLLYCLSYMTYYDYRRQSCVTAILCTLANHMSSAQHFQDYQSTT